MNDSPYILMQRAVDIVERSPHPTNKIAATLAGEGFSLSATNHWPPLIEQHFGQTTKIGNSSGTIHAETACILEALQKQFKTEGGHLFVTDPPCPNCMKNMAEAGIRVLYIDHKGFDKDFAQRRGHHFVHMAMKIAEHAGIAIYKIFRKEEKLEPIFEPPEGYKPPLENPVKIISTPCKKMDQTAFASCTAHNKSGETLFMSASAHPVIGYTSQTLDEPEDRYNFILEPVTRLLMSAARQGLTIEPESFYTAQTPTARELVNFVGAGLNKITIENPEKSRNEWGLRALKQLRETGILKAQLT